MSFCLLLLFAFEFAQIHELPGYICCLLDLQSAVVGLCIQFPAIILLQIGYVNDCEVISRDNDDHDDVKLSYRLNGLLFSTLMACVCTLVHGNLVDVG